MSLFDELVPSPDASRIDWPAITAAFDWFRALEACPQDPIYHAEGNVLVHTRLVAEALVADRDWRSARRAEQTSLFWGALLHDVAKPETTRHEDGGRISSPGHSRRGQIVARRILWRLGVPYRQREEICHLVTHHQSPLFLMNRNRPERRIHLISQQTRCDLLAVLALADANGRDCPDRSRLTDNIALFHEQAREEGCLNRPRAFANDHSRFLYFRKEDRAPDYAAHDDWRGPATVLCGLPASGKDSWIARHGGDAEVVSLDDLRNALDLAPGSASGELFSAARERARTSLRAGQPLIWNATNLGRDRRAQIIDLFADYKMRVRIVYLETSEPELAERNAARERPVPGRAIERMLDHWEPPDRSECHELEIVLS